MNKVRLDLKEKEIKILTPRGMKQSEIKSIITYFKEEHDIVKKQINIDKSIKYLGQQINFLKPSSNLIT